MNQEKNTEKYKYDLYYTFWYQYDFPACQQSQTQTKTRSRDGVDSSYIDSFKELKVESNNHLKKIDGDRKK